MFTSRKPIAITMLMVILMGIVAASCAVPTPQTVEKVVEKPVEVTKVVEKVVKETVVVQATQFVEKAVVVTATPAPTVAGADMAADQVIQYVTRGFGRLDPASEGGFGRFIIEFLWMPFYMHDYQHNLQLWLATSVEPNADQTVWTIKINPKAVWSDGSPVTAQEAKDYWTYGLNPKACVGCYLRDFTGFDLIKGVKEFADGKVTDIAGLVVKDDKTLEVTLTGPDALFPHRIALFDTGFVKMEDVQKYQIKAADGSMVFNANAQTRVNGPYMIKEWDLDKQKFEIVQNPKWWGDKKPKITKIVAQQTADENVSYIMWQNNEVDIAFLLGTLREKIRQSDPKTIYLIPYPTNLFYNFMQNIPPLDDLNVRKALIHAVDWEKAIAAAWEGTRTDRLMTSILTPEMKCYKKGNWPEWGYNPVRAKEELAKSKYATPDKLGKIRISTGGVNPSYIRVAEVMAEQWKNNLGITDVEIKPGWLDAWGQDSALVQVRRTSQGAIIPDAANLLSSHFNYYKGANYMNLQDDELDKMLAQLAIMKRDDPKYCDLSQQAEARLLGQYVIVPMIWDVYEYSVKPWVKNFGTNVDNNWATLMDMYIAKH